MYQDAEAAVTALLEIADENRAVPEKRRLTVLFRVILAPGDVFSDASRVKRITIHSLML